MRCWGGLLLVAACGRWGFSPRELAGDAHDSDSSVLDASAPCHTGAWGTPTVIAGTVTGSEEADPSISADELTLYFESNRLPSQGRGLWRTQRATKADAFGPPTQIAELETSSDDLDPEIADDELTIYFTSNTTGNYRLYSAQRATTTASFGAPATVTFANDSPEPRSGASISTDELELLYTRDLDVAFATRPTKAVRRRPSVVVRLDRYT